MGMFHARHFVMAAMFTFPCFANFVIKQPHMLLSESLLTWRVQATRRQMALLGDIRRRGRHPRNLSVLHGCEVLESSGF